MTKKIILGAFTVALLFSAAGAFAIDLGVGPGGLAGKAAQQSGLGGATETTLSQTLGKIVQVVLSFVGVIFLVLMIYGGFIWMFARGDETKIDKAKDIIRGTIVGLIITVGAYSITSFVVPKILESTAGPKDVGAPNEWFCCQVSGKATTVEPSVASCRARCIEGSGAAAEICNYPGPFPQNVAADMAARDCAQ